jgi:hypothetical protein
MKKLSNGNLETTINLIKKTKNTSVKNLTVTYFDKDEKPETTNVVPNMYQMWKGAKSYYSNDANLGKRMIVEFNGKIIKDIRGERKSSGRLWLVDKMQIGQHVKNPTMKLNPIETKSTSK